MSEMSRRRFIGTSAGALGLAAGLTRAAAPLAGLASAQRSVLGANDRIRAALIGCGGMGRGDMMTFLNACKEVDFPLLCDVDGGMLAKAVKAVEDARQTTPQTVKDFREVMERKDIDICVVATPDHWHALPTIHACQAGKDVYCEKPLATSVGESAAMLKAARRHDRVVQMGTQWRSCPHFAEAVDYVQSGKLGKIRLVRCWAYLRWVHSVGKPADASVPPGVDYDMWLGPAPKRPFNPARFHFSFRWFWDYAGGLMTDWGVHLINIALWGMKAGMPRAVSSSGGKYIYDDISETPDTQHTIYDYPDFTMVWEHQMTGGRGVEGREHGAAFYGTEGTLIVGYPGWEVIPEVKLSGKSKELPATLAAEKHSFQNTDGRPEHVRNFLDCVKSRKRPVEDIEIGHHITTAALLGNVALRTGQTVRWDAEHERALGDTPEELITKPYRKPWKLES